MHGPICGTSSTGCSTSSGSSGWTSPSDPKYIIHSPLDDFIPFNEWFIFPYGSWFFLLAGVTALLWWFDTASYD